MSFDSESGSQVPTESPARFLRPEVLQSKRYTAGLTIDEIKERYNLQRVVKLASNENPLGASPLVVNRLRERADMVFRYPHSSTPRLAKALAAHLGVAVERLVLGNGSDELIDLLIRVRCRPGGEHGGDEVLACRPCFSMYQLQAKLCGVAFRQVPLEADFSIPWQGLLDTVTERTALIFLTSPDNPTGYTATAAQLEAFARALPEHCLLVVDEAYIDFVRDQAAHSLLSRLADGKELQNVVLLRTFSKLYGLAGLRLGYGVFPAWLADYLWRVRLPFSVNLMAEEAGLAALEDQAFVQASLETTWEGLAYLEQELGLLGCTVWPSQANFLLMTPPAGGPTAQELFEGLLRRGVIVRPLASSGLPDHLRVSVGNPEENRLFLQELATLLAKGSPKA